MSLMQRFAARLALAIGARPPAGPCPAPEDIVAWQERALVEDEATRVQSHVAHCQDCYALWSGLVSLNPSEQLDSAGATASGRERSGWRWWFALPAVALGVLGITLLPTLFNNTGPSGGLVAYDLTVQGGMQVRGSTSAPLTLADGSALEIVLTPESATDQPLSVGLFALTLDTAVQLDVPVDITPKGVAVIDVIVGQKVVIPSGTRALAVVTSSGALPLPEELADLPASPAPFVADSWRAWRLDVDTSDAQSP